MGSRAVRIPLIVVMAGVTAITGCKAVVSAGPSPVPSAVLTAPAPSGPATEQAPAGHGHRLAKIADEGQVTYSIKLTHCRARAGGQLPDPRCTPGSLDPAVTQATIGSTICRSGYTAKVRPPSSETARAKYDVAYPAYHIPDGTTSELDHLVSLELGGSNDITNLWPEVGSLPNPKDKVENALNRAVCDGQVSLAAAQRAIATDWMTAESRLGLG
jgi:hypothetical protein